MSFSSEDKLGDEVAADDDSWADSPTGEQSPRKKATISFAVDDAETSQPDDAETPKSRPLLLQSRSSKMSFYHKEAAFSGKKRRSVYMEDLLIKRQQTMAQLLLSDEGEDQDEEKGDFQNSSARKLSNDMHAAFVRHLKSHVKDKDTFAMPKVEIRVKNFSFNVPISKREAEGGSKIPTVFNYSPIYWCKKAGEKCLSLERNDSIRKKEVRSVLKNVNLALEPGKMYLIIGPPSSGKTSLLNGE